MSAFADSAQLREPFVIPIGLTEPSIPGLIIAPDGSTVDTSTATTTVFFMRPLLSRTPVINAGAAQPVWPPDDDGNNIQYAWQPGDTVIEGKYMGWWGYELPSETLQETGEFPIIITDQGPGFGTQTGAVVDGVSEWMPTTLRALRDSPEFGDRFLQSHADYVKRIVLGTAVSPDLEIDYDPALVSYLSKRTAVRLITPARDYWARERRSVQTQAPVEQVTYPDMLAALDALRQQLMRELPSDWRQLQFLVPGLPQLRVEPMPMSSACGWPTTPDPAWTPRPRTGGPNYGDLFLP